MRRLYRDPRAGAGAVSPAPATDTRHLVRDGASAMTSIPDPGRAAYVRGLRDLAEFLEAHPSVPLPSTGTFSYYPNGEDEQARAEVDRIATLLKAAPRDTGHYVATRAFGPIAYQATAIPERDMDLLRAAGTYHGHVQPVNADVEGVEGGAS